MNWTIIISIELSFIFLLLLLNITRQLILLAKALEIDASEKYKIEYKGVSFKSLIQSVFFILAIHLFIYFFQIQDPSTQSKFGYFLTVVGALTPAILIIPFKPRFLEQKIHYAISISHPINRSSQGLLPPYAEVEPRILDKFKYPEGYTDDLWRAAEQFVKEATEELVNREDYDPFLLIHILKLIMEGKNDKRNFYKHKIFGEFTKNVSDNSNPLHQAKILDFVIFALLPIIPEDLQSNLNTIFESIYVFLKSQPKKGGRTQIQFEELLEKESNKRIELFNLYIKCIERAIIEEKYQEKHKQEIVHNYLFKLLNDLYESPAQYLDLLEHICDHLNRLFPSVKKFLPDRSSNDYKKILEAIKNIQLKFVDAKRTHKQIDELLAKIQS